MLRLVCVIVVTSMLATDVGDQVCDVGDKYHQSPMVTYPDHILDDEIISPIW